MRKIYFFAITIIMLCLQVSAQPKMEKSEVFDEPLSEGWTKLLLLKNGNTLYFHYGCKKGVEVIVFNKNRKKVQTNILSNNWNANRKRRIKICGLYEINKEPVIFLQYFQDETPTLYRLRINPDNGRLIKEDKLGACAKNRKMRLIGNFDVNEEIYVVKDDASDNYAVFFTDEMNKDIDKRIKVAHYSESHKLLNTAYCKVTQSDLKYLNFIGAAVDGDKSVYLVSWGAKNEKGKEGHVYISKFISADSTFIHKTLDFTEDFRRTLTDLKYDHANNRLVMLSNTVAEVRGNAYTDMTTTYACFLTYIDPDDLSLKGVTTLENKKVNDYMHNTLGVNEGYNGLPQRLIINKDNTLTVLMESLTRITIRSSKGSVVGERTVLGNIGVSTIGADGMEKSGFAIMKRQMFDGILESLYMTGRDHGEWKNEPYARKYANENLYKSCEYIRTENASYVFFNDNPKNDKKQESETKRKLADNTDLLNTICYTIKNGEAKKSYLFGEPVGKHNSRACFIEASCYDRATNTYVTVVSEQHGLKYQSRMAWIHFD
jgi:hypothetical protein